MQTFRVDDMVCGHCASTITKAVQSIDAHARIEVDLARHLIHIEPTDADTQYLSIAIAEAGYTPESVKVPPESNSPRVGGCCCGSGVSSCRT